MQKLWSKFKETPVEYAGWELLCMRALFAWLLWSMLPSAIPYVDQPVPNGLGHLIDLTFLSEQELYHPLRLGFAVSLLVFVCGLLPVLSLGYPAILLIMVGALENSQGAIGHHLQLTCMVAGAMWVGYLGGVRGTGLSFWRASLKVHQCALHLAKVIIVVSYMTSACVKLIASGGAWIAQLPNISLQLVKTHANVYYDTLWPQTGWAATELPYLIAEHPFLTRLFFTPGLLLELFAFIALLGRRPAMFMGIGLLMMHLLIRLVMNLSFSAHEWLLVIFLINLPYLVWSLVRKFIRR